VPVTIYRSHSSKCPHRSEGRRFTRCTCPIGIDKRFAFPGGKIEVLDTTDWKTAERIARDIDLGISPAETATALAGPKTLEQAVEEYLDSLRFRMRSHAEAHDGMAEDTFRMHLTLMAQLRAFALHARPALSTLADFNHATVRRFIHSWAKGGLAPHPDDVATRQVTKPMGPLARKKKLERLRQFFKYAVLNKWIPENPTAGEKGAAVKVVQKQAFTPEEMAVMLAKADEFIAEKTEARAHAAAIRLRALVLFMRFSGLRISDAVGCQITWVKNGQVTLTTRKQHRLISVALPPNVIEALNECPPISQLYWFWTGKGNLRTAKNTAWRQLNELFKAAGIPDAHPHRFRDTFAVSLLEAGKTLQEVADALGDTLAVVQRHYNPGSDKRQQRLDQAVRDTWRNDPILKALEAKKAKGQSTVVTMPRRAGGGR
jgi:integrase